MEKNTFLLRDTEAFMRGELDNVTVAGGQILLDMVQGGYVPYGCYTSPAIPLPLFDALRVSWNASTPPGTAVEAQARVLVDGNWTAWSSFGRWSPYLTREGAKPACRGPLALSPDLLELDSKTAAQAQLRIYLYTKEEKQTPAVSLLGVSVRQVDVIPAGGRPVNACLHLMPYSLARRAPALRPVMDLAIGLASLTNRWGADILPEEFALAMRDCQPGQPGTNLCFAAAAAGCWGFPTWVGWADLGRLRAELRAGYGMLVALEATPAQQTAGFPPLRYVTLRGFGTVGGVSCALLNDPWTADTDFDVECSLPLDDFLVAWNNVALFLRKRQGGPTAGCPTRTSVWLRHTEDTPEGIYLLYQNGAARALPDDFCGTDDAPAGVLAWSVPDERPHATTAHRAFHYAAPEQGGIRLERQAGEYRKYTVYAIDANGSMRVGDVMV